MKMKALVILFLIFTISCKESQRQSTVWKINNTGEVGGYAVTIHGNPLLKSEGDKEFLVFDGQDDGLLVNKNPISGMEGFIIEVDIKPFSGYPENREQRFLHIQDPDNENRRILIELRLNENNEWYGDWYMKTENEALTLIDSTLTHPVSEWATIALTYKDGTMTGSINGKQELSEKIQYLPIGESAKTSIGTRMDKRSWFKGAIKEVRIYPDTSNH